MSGEIQATRKLWMEIRHCFLWSKLLDLRLKKEDDRCRKAMENPSSNS